ncbi:Vacuolar protein sorting-associated protein-like protein [Capsicum annuum]|nr:Vacuolar protein sorting-associated protein-like protein [Capsicum annuum]
MTNCLCKPLIQGLVELRLFSLVFISLLIQLEISSYVEWVTGFKKALLGPRLLEAERLKKKSSPSTDEEKKEMSLVPYSYVAGSLMYGRVCTRPDIARYWCSGKDDYVPSLCWLSYQLAERVPETNRELSRKKSISSTRAFELEFPTINKCSEVTSFAESGIANSRRKGIRWLPRHPERRKGIVIDEMLWGVENQHRSGDSRIGQPFELLLNPWAGKKEPGELKDLSSQRKRKQKRFL